MRPRLPSRLPEKRAAARPSRALLSIALLLLASSPSLVESSRARRRHPSSFHTENVNKPRGYDHKPSPVSSGLTREESSIPGVSIWTSKKAAGAGDFAVRPRISKDTGRGSAKVKDFKTVRGQRQTHGGERDSFLGGCQDALGDVGDADVEPPFRGAREGEDDVDEDEYDGVLTSEEEEDGQGNGDAVQGRLLEEGGGSDSQEDETDSEEPTDDDDGDGSESYDDGSGDSQSEDDDDDDGALRSASNVFGRGGLRAVEKRGLRLERDGGRGERQGVVSLAKKYKDDEEACFARVKELWDEKVIPPLSQTEIGELSERVLVDQKKLMAAAPTEWNSGLSKITGASKGHKRGVERQGDGAQDEHSSLELLYRLLLAEMQGDGSSGGLNNRWIDRDALLQLRGAATLAHNPKYLRHTANLPRVARGVRLVAPEATHSMQAALARSLGHSTGSKLVLLDAKMLDSVRTKALAEGIPKEHLSSRQLTSALLELARDDGSPFVVFLMDKGSAALQTRGVCHRLIEELKSDSSRVLFLLSSASDPSVPGSSPGGDGGFQDGQQQQQQQAGAVFGNPLQWPPSSQQPGQSKRGMQSDQPKKNYIFLQQTPQEGAGEGGGYFGGRSPNGGRGGRSGGRGQPGQGFGRGMSGPPIPPQMLEQLLRDAMKNMKAGQQEKKTNTSDGSGSEQEGREGEGGSGDGTGPNGEIPPELLEALSDALNDDDFKRTLEQAGKQLGKDMNQGFSIMFSTSAAPTGNGQEGEGGDDGKSDPWGMGGSSGSPSNRQSPSSLSWLTNLRKGIMSGDEGKESGDDMDNEDDDTDIDSHSGSGSSIRHNGGSSSRSSSRSGSKSNGKSRKGGSGGAGSGGGGKADPRRGMDLAPSGTEMRAFGNLFEDVAVNPPQDAVLRQHWDTWVKEDEGKHNTRQNRQALMIALRRNMLACPDLKRLDPLLARHRLTEAETGQVVLASLKVELSKVAVAIASASTVGGLAERGGERGSPPQLPPTPRKTSKGRLVISRQSMETAFAAVCKAYVPRPGQPLSRTREEVTALAQHDRHEQALVSNVILPKDIGVTYDMIGGLGGAKELLRQCITYPLRFPHLYNEGIAKEAVKGVLLFGPPGTGKTMLAKAVATEGGATFLSVDASVIENKWLGESEKNARAVFTLARRLSPCVIFIDEVDSVLSSREKYDDTTHGTLTSVKTTLMQEWDGLRSGGDRVVVIASTNRPFDLDEAVLRRLPRRIMVDLPDAETREDILKVSMAQNRVDSSVNFTAITAELEGFTGSDIKEVCREAVVRIAHEKAQELDQAEGGVRREEVDLTAKLRPVTMNDFREARKKLTASVSDKGRELARVWEWNEEYGEVKKKRSDASAHHLSMYL